MEEDVLGLQRVVMGHDVLVCDLCGRSGPDALVERLAGARTIAEPVEYLHLCQDCRDRLERGEIQLDLVVDSEDD